ncbi:hypothetical protein [Paenibacillus oceani]|uniref:Uncharacterized protein n=1 Tax=Paenibacillus oceani TaxID=2772510 RepID=A0A927H2L1_9BACL|nr:hypothetical protein [Paenibacillus oceani]MBD2865382.1 hypothetical protein [Paenibacillus oceani]
MNWLARRGVETETDRLLFISRSVSVDMFNLKPAITSRFPGGEHIKKITKRDYSLSKKFKEHVYDENKQCFRAIDRFVRKKYLANHHICLHTLQQLRKEKEGAFPQICPYAFAYVFWKHTLLQTDHFHTAIRADETNRRTYDGFEFATQLIQNHINDFKEKLFGHTNLYEFDNRRLFDWIVNRFTSDLCLNYFYKWLEIAKDGSEQIRVPDWNQVLIMATKSIPNMIFKHKFNVNEPQEVHIIKKESRNIVELEKIIYNMQCPHKSKRVKKELRNMNSFTPQSVSMRNFEEPNTEQDKSLQVYVDQYVSRLTI